MENSNEDKILEEIKKIKQEQELQVVEEKTEILPNAFDNNLANEIMKNDTALQIAKEKFDELKSQKKLAGKMGAVVQKKARTDIETADLQVGKQILDNKVEKARQKNELIKCKNEKKYLNRESRHKLTMQKIAQRKEKYNDLILRHCRKKVKNANNKWEYQTDKDGNPMVVMPNLFELWALIVFDSIVTFLNQTAEVFSGINKIVFKIMFVSLLMAFIFIPPFRDWVFSLISLK